MQGPLEQMIPRVLYQPGKVLAPKGLRVARKVIIAVLGTTVLAVGVALIVLPGPAIVVIPLGLTILATEFLWARRLLRRFKQGTTQLLARWRLNAGEARP